MRSGCGARGRGHTPRSRAARASARRHDDRRVRCSLDWDRRSRVTPGSMSSRRVILPGNRLPLLRIARLAASQEAWPEPRLGRRKSPWREPWWNAGRRAGALRPSPRRFRCGGFCNTLAGVPLPFLQTVRRREGRSVEEDKSPRIRSGRGFRQFRSDASAQSRGRRKKEVCVIARPEGRKQSSRAMKTGCFVAVARVVAAGLSLAVTPPHPNLLPARAEKEEKRRGGFTKGQRQCRNRN